MNRIEDHLDILSKRIDGIDMHINSNEIPNQGIFFNGQIFDAYVFSSEIINKSKTEIILIDRSPTPTTASLSSTVNSSII